jgi:hypothetical protein
MKDAKGHGSNPRGTHASGVDTVGRGSLNGPLLYHGSPTGKPGRGPVHVGTPIAARQALEARIGIPADGRGWDGTREYGKTLLAGSDRLDSWGRSYPGNPYPKSGYNMDAPKQDYYATSRGERATFGDGSPVPFDAKPGVAAYRINGPMGNTPAHPYSDGRANGIAKRQANSGKAKSGYYYKNDGEDSGSISAVVPSEFLLKA